QNRLARMAAPVPDHKHSKKERRDRQRFRRNHEGEL
ncbi:MAG TPA: RNA-binding protein, partial [Alcanivorax sp.]|nr:RNA-binding protein [Alcanivorax sp.]